MPIITDPPPPGIQAELDNLNLHMDNVVPARADGRNLLIATWNLRAFGSLTRKWTSESGDSPKRDLRGLRIISEIIQRFDVVAIQEVVGNLRALRHLMKALGDDWSFLMTDVTLGDAGNNERLAFVYDRTRLRLSGLACELVVPPEWVSGAESSAVLRRQFARTPYAVSFRAGDTTFILVTLHVNFGDPTADRAPELRGIANWLRDWANRSNRYSHNLICLGDLNIEAKGGPLWNAFTSTGLTVPDELNVPKTIFSNNAEPTSEKFYDQIAWFQTASGVKKLSMPYVTAGYVDFLPFVYQDAGLTKSQISWRVSDHYPLWAEFSLP